MKNKKKNNIINFPASPTKIERQVEAILFAASEPLDVETIEKRQGYKIACLEEIAWRNKWLTDAQVRAHGEALAKNGYGQYLLDLID